MSVLRALRGSPNAADLSNCAQRLDLVPPLEQAPKFRSWGEAHGSIRSRKASGWLAKSSREPCGRMAVLESGARVDGFIPFMGTFVGY
jgi:hypothetical protein